MIKALGCLFTLLAILLAPMQRPRTRIVHPHRGTTPGGGPDAGTLDQFENFRPLGQSVVIENKAESAGQDHPDRAQAGPATWLWGLSPTSRWPPCLQERADPLKTSSWRLLGANYLSTGDEPGFPIQDAGRHDRVGPGKPGKLSIGTTSIGFRTCRSNCLEPSPGSAL